MPRRALPRTRTNPIDSFMTAFTVGMKKDPIPYNAELLRAIVEALLDRIGRMNPYEERMARLAISRAYAWDVIDQFIPVSLWGPRTFLAAVMPLLNRLCEDESLRRQPDPNLLRSILKNIDPKAKQVFEQTFAERAPLKERLRAHLSEISYTTRTIAGGPKHVRSTLQWQRDMVLQWCERYPFGMHRVSWFQEHGWVMHCILSSWPCKCKYRDFPSLSKEEIEGCRSATEITKILVARLHGISPLTVEKLLKPSSRTR